MTNPNEKARRPRRNIADKSIPVTPAEYDLTALPAALPPAPEKPVKAQKEKRERFVMPPLAELPLDVLLDQIRCHSESLHLMRDEPRMTARSERVIAQAMAEITRRMQQAAR